MHKIILVTGDPSGDGHDKTEDQLIESNLSNGEITEAYAKGTSIVGFDFSKEVCSEYEERNISEDNLELLRKAGYEELIGDERHAWLSENQLDTDLFVEIYLFIVKLGNPNFECKLLEIKRNSIEIGGYGLFE